MNFSVSAFLLLALVSTCEVPTIISPSRGIFSPAVTVMVSPTLTRSGEDDSRIRTGHAPENMTLIRKIALNLLAKETSSKVSKKAKRLKAGWDNDFLIRVPLA